MKKILKTQSYWSNKDFISELNKRSAEYENGKKKGVSWQAVKNAIANAVTQDGVYCHNTQN